jgi:hypothetical protein
MNFRYLLISMVTILLVSGVAYAGATHLSELDVSGDLTVGGTVTVTGYVTHVDYFFNVKADSIESGCTSIIADTLAEVIENADTYSGFIQPDVSRNVKISCAGYKTCTGLVNVIGVDAQGATISESFEFGDTPLSDGSQGTTTVAGNKAFARITTFSGNAAFNANAGASDTIQVGYSVKLGLTNDIYGDTPFKVIENDLDVKPTAVIIGGTRDTYDPSGTPDGSMDFIIHYRSRKLTVTQ